MYRRFSLVSRLVHGGLLVGFFGAALTGLPLRLGRAPWVAVWVQGLGGVDSARRLHRGAALLLGLCAGAHLLTLGYVWFGRRQRGLFWGPESLVPQPQDWRDFWQHVRWFLGRGPHPQFDRWAYWQKVDYWAAVVGMLSIGSTGVALWQAEWFGRWLPGWLLTLCVQWHGHEAILAVGVISLFHFFHVHLHPDRFPADPSMFTGRIDAATLRRRHGRQYARLHQSGRLAELQVAPPPRWIERTLRWLWIVPVGLGWLLFLLALGALVGG